jgi:hypothetical protein
LGVQNSWSSFFNHLECKHYPKPPTTVEEKLDFKYLWAAFQERGIKQDEEVIIIWTINNYLNIAPFQTISMQNIFCTI